VAERLDPLVELAAPPRPPLTFRVGVVGHRPGRLDGADTAALREVLVEVLSAVRDEVSAVQQARAGWFADGPPVLRANSPLAEGADRLFADVALDLGWALCCPMPFSRAEYEHDFEPPQTQEPDSVARFRAILERAAGARGATCFELDGRREDEASAYGDCGRVLLRQSDLLLVVWDGRREQRRGGTEDLLDEALRSGVPVAWIEAAAPHRWCLLDGRASLPPVHPDGRCRVERQGTPEGVRTVVRTRLDLPAAEASPADEPGRHERTDAEQLDAFFAERHPLESHAVFWRLFLGVIAEERWVRGSTSIGGFEETVRRDWPQDRSTAVARTVDTLRPYYAWTDGLAALNAARYRSAFVLAFLMAAAAVGCALMPVALAWTSAAHHLKASVFVAAEVVLIAEIILVIRAVRRGRWHERWIDYRLAAELVRHLRLVVPLGGDRPFPQMPAHWTSYGTPAWVQWYVRAIERHVGLPDASVDAAHLADCLGQTGTMIVGQREWHQHNAEVCRTMERRLETAGLGLLGLTLAACVGHLLPLSWVHAEQVGLPLTFLCGFLPALGAALAGINNQAEFRRIAKRSGSMAGQLALLERRAEDLQGAAPRQIRLRAPDVRALASDAARVMVNEVAEWRVVVLDRPASWPA